MAVLVTLPLESSHAAIQLPVRPIRLFEYHRMIDEGILGEDERLELIEGVIVPMAPQSERHAAAIERLTRALVLHGPSLRVRPQLPLTLQNQESEPEPDVAVVTSDTGRSRRHPERALLVVEVASDSLAKDRGPKARLYARAGIPEYWIVNLVDDQVEAYADPDPAAGTYRRARTFARGETAVSVAIAGFRIDVDELAGR